jgi:hypothetical protein
LDQFHPEDQLDQFHPDRQLVQFHPDRQLVQFHLCRPELLLLQLVPVVPVDLPPQLVQLCLADQMRLLDLADLRRCSRDLGNRFYQLVQLLLVRQFCRSLQPDLDIQTLRLLDLELLLRLVRPVDPALQLFQLSPVYQMRLLDLDIQQHLVLQLILDIQQHLVLQLIPVYHLLLVHLRFLEPQLDPAYLLILERLPCPENLPNPADRQFL